MSILAAVDMTLVVFCGINIFEKGPSVLVLFGFEFFILFITLVSIFLRYLLHLIDTRMENTWTNKFTYLFYLELIAEVMKLIIYLIFFLIIFSYYGMPLHIVRDLWISMKNLQRRITAYFRYRKIAANLNERFPNPTEEELEETMDRTCIICREEMISTSSKKLPCTHLFHIDCLRMWVQRQQTCPTCRSIIPTTNEQQQQQQRPPVTPTPPPPPPAAAAAEPPQQAQGAPVLQAPPAQVPRFQTPGIPVAAPSAAAPPGTPTPIPATAPVTPTTQGAPHSPYPEQAPGGHHVPLPFAGVPGHHPFMPPFMFPPGMGMGIPSFGMHPFGMMPPPPGHVTPGASGTVHHQTHHSYLDPAAIQQQIHHLHAQLSALQAASQAYGVPAHSGVPVVPPGTDATSTTAAQPTTSTVTATPVGNTSSIPVQPSAQAPGSTRKPKNTTTVAEQMVEEEEETKENSTTDINNSTTSSPVETLIPPAPKTEAERRREELRRRYNQIYSQSNQSSTSTSTSTTDTNTTTEEDKSK
jgi:E3 ubiquitin-protein ligase synoviolin